MGTLPRFCSRRVDSPLSVSYSSNFAAIMMRDLFVLCLVPLAVLSTPMPYKDDGYDKEYKGDSYDGDSYTKDDVRQEACLQADLRHRLQRVLRELLRSHLPHHAQGEVHGCPLSALRRRPDQPAEAQVLRGGGGRLQVARGCEVPDCPGRLHRPEVQQGPRACLRYCLRHHFLDQGEEYLHQRPQPVLQARGEDHRRQDLQDLYQVRLPHRVRLRQGLLRQG